MPITIDRIGLSGPSRARWELFSVILLAVTGLLVTVAIAAATSLPPIEMPF